MNISTGTITSQGHLGRIAAAVVALFTAMLLMAAVQATPASAAFVANPTTPQDPSTLTVKGGFLRVGTEIDQALEEIDPAPVFTGTIQADGTINIPKESVDFGELEFEVDTSIPILGTIQGVIGIQILPQQDLTGTIDPITGEATMDLWFRIRAYRISGSSLLDVGNACYLGGAGVNSIHVPLSTSTGPDPGSALSLGGAPYDLGTGTARFATQGFAVPGHTGCSGLAAGQINGLLGIPTADTGAEFEIEFDPKPISAADITITANPPANTNQTNAHFEFSSNVPSGIDYECRIDGGSWSSCDTMDADYTGLADGSHTFDVRAVAFGNELGDASYSWNIDTLVPVYTVTSNRTGLVNTRGATVTIGVNKAMPSGATECELDGNPYLPCVNPAPGDDKTVSLAGLADGTHTFTVRGTDSVGNASTDYSATWTVDATKPVVTIDDGPVGIVSDENVEFEFTVTDNMDPAPVVQCQVRNMRQNLPDGAIVQAWTNCASPFQQARGTGEWRLQVRATDNAGNVSDVQNYDWEVKTDKPDIVDATFTGPGQGVNTATSMDEDGGTASGDAVFEFEAVDGDENPLVPGDDVEFECWLDGNPLGACESPMTLFDLTGGTPFAAGSHTFEVQPTTTTVPPIVGETKGYTWIVDATNPTAAFVGGPATHHNSAISEFELNVDGTGSQAGAQCRLTGPDTNEAWTDCQSSTVQTLTLNDGDYTLRMRAVDQAGNLSSPVRWDWNVDTSAPAANIQATPVANSPSSTATFGFQTNDNDNNMTAYCRLDGDADAPCDSRTGHTFSGVADGEHTFTLTGVDRAGNETVRTHTWRVDTTAPALNITDGPAALTNQTNAAFKFEASDGGSGIASITCQVDAFAPVSGDDCQNGNVWNFFPGPYTSGDHTFKVTVTDNAGNRTVKTRDWTIQTLAPAVGIATQIGETYMTNAEVRFLSPAAGASFECKLDAGDWEACSSPTAYTDLDTGDHVFTVRTIDTLGNISDGDSMAWRILEVGEQGVNYDLNVTVDGDGAGTVTSVPAGIDCGNDCTASFQDGTRVTLTATPDANSDFAGWTGAVTSTDATIDVYLTEAQNVTATFTKKDDGGGTGEECAEGEIGTWPDCKVPAQPPIDKPVGQQGAYNPKTGKLSIKTKCPPRFQKCNKAVLFAVTGQGKKAKFMSKKAVVKNTKGGKAKTVVLTIKPRFRPQVEAMTTVNAKRLFVRIKATGKLKKGKKKGKKVTQQFHHKYKVRVKG